MTERGAPSIRPSSALRALLALLVFALGCGPGKPAYDASRDRSIPHWQDALDQIPEIYVVVRTTALKHDPIYGSFMKTVLRAAAARSKDASVARMLDAFEGCEEVVIGMRSADDALLVLKGVRADLDPTKLTEADGRALWRPSGTQGGPHELVREDRVTGQQASLFLLPGRVWVIAVGEARDRARQAYTTPAARPEPTIDPVALAVVRLDGPSLVRAVPQLRRGELEQLGRKLSSVEIALRPAKQGMFVTFAYPVEDPAAWAELALKQIGERLAESPKLTWLRGMQVRREGNSVIARLELPPALLKELPGVTGEGAL